VRALYRASQAGVKIDLIVRDSAGCARASPACPRTSGCISVVGRFLEHARVLYFHNNGKSEYYLGSADVMQRNLERRVEVLAPIDDPRLQAELRVFLDAQLGDERGAWDMQPDGSYRAAPGRHRLRSTQQQLLERTDARVKEATRLRRRKVAGITRDRAFAVMLGVIGTCLTVVGVHALAGVRRGIDPAVPTATVRPR
jgi:polyphosphate kinase